MTDQVIKTADSARVEANRDAAMIQGANNSADAYKLFVNEIDSTRFSSDAVRAQYEENLVKSLGGEMNSLMVEYLNDPRSGAAMKLDGQISRQSIVERQNNRSLSSVDKFFLPNISLNFDNLRNADSRDGRKNTNADGITDRDLRAQINKSSYDSYMSSATKPNAHFAQSLLNPDRAGIYDRLETSDNGLFTGKDGNIAKGSIKEFLKDARKYSGPDKDNLYPPDMLKDLQFIYDNWDTPQIKLMRKDNGKGNLNRDSIARGSGYPGGYNEFVQKFNADKQAKLAPVKQEPLTLNFTPIQYKPVIVEVKSPIEFQSTKLTLLARQESTQGYWHVANKMLVASPIADEARLETSRQNVILMRALQGLHAKQQGKLGGHQFLPSEKDFDMLKTEIDKYASSRSVRTRQSAEILKKRLDKLRSEKA